MNHRCGSLLLLEFRLDGLEIVAHLSGSLVAKCAVLLNRPGDDGVQFLRNAGLKLTGRHDGQA